MLCCNRFMHIDHREGNLFYFKCSNPNHSYGKYMTMGKDGRFWPVIMESARDAYARENNLGKLADRKSKIQSRVRMADGTILSGLAGLRELDRRRRMSETGTAERTRFTI